MVRTMVASLTVGPGLTSDMLVVKLGGPVYRIGVGGGAASSVQVSSDASQIRNTDVLTIITIRVIVPSVMVPIQYSGAIQHYFTF